ncbi:MAG TPA: ATP-binding cassette domain-containing protein [Spongiibacteraceae bacterium]|nr:ATP-binding cassette domain-containing protein [Spongiibacteraceae bacterium]
MLLQALFGLTALIQVAGIASLAPFIAVIANRELIHKNSISAFIYDHLGFTNDVSFLMFFALGVMAFIIASNSIAAITTWFTVKFSLSLGLELQSSLYRNYLHKDYVYFSKNNSSKMMSMITQEAPRFTYMVISPLLNLISQFFIVIIIAAGLIYIDPALAVTAIIIVGGSYLGVFRLAKQRLFYHGEKIFETNEKKYKLLAESLGGIKEVKLLATEAIYEKRVHEVNAANTHSNAVIGLLGDFPKFAIETLAFCALLGLALSLLSNHSDPAHVISILSLYAMAGYKLLPAAQIIFKSAAQIKANCNVLTELYPAVMEGRATGNFDSNMDNSSMSIDGDIQLTDVCYGYPEAESVALKHINLTIKKNSLIAFVGSSGAGKSTLADLLLGFLPPTTGTMRVGDTSITRTNARAWQKHLGYVPQNIFLLDDTITANITFGTIEKTIDMQRVKAAARMANIDQLVESLPGQYSFVVGERGALLSGGQKQRIGIARALYHNADILILDEATSALDNLTEQEIIKTITGLKATKTIIMIAHRLSTIRNADQIVFLEDGAIQDIGSFEQLSAHNKKFQAMALTTPGAYNSELNVSSY